MRTRLCAVYILTNRPGGTLYIGVTSDLRRRIWEHRQGLDPDSFTARYRLFRLVHYETTTDISAAIAREKQLKGWRRPFKVRLIEQTNPTWADLSEGWV